MEKVLAGVETGGKLSPELARRVEVMIRSRSDVPPEYAITISDRKKSEVAGYDQITVVFSTKDNASKPLTFLLSADNKTLAQFTKFDLSVDPKDKVSAAGRPARGGPENAPVVIVGFDDLECPFCAQFHASLFPAVLERYKNQVHVVYRDFPEDEHPWAMHAAVDANCLAAVSPVGYWNFVDLVHARSAEITALLEGDAKKVAKPNVLLDKFVEEEGGRQKVNAADLDACVKKQDETKMKASLAAAEADPLRVGATPTLFINGEKFEGVVPIEVIFKAIDGALIAAGQTPPPEPVQAVPVPAATPAKKSGS